MTGQVLRIETLVNIGEEEAYLLAEEEGETSGDLDVSQEPDALKSKNAGALNKDHQKPLAPQTPSHPTPVFPHDEEEDNIEPATKFKKKKRRTANAMNYTIGDVNVLLDIIEEQEPTGMNGWALVHRDYNRYAYQNERPRRQSEVLKKKYDKLHYYQKQTGDPTCPD
ncbi:hypothetical protein FGB62_115g013 [Gracilaria domingensis]|nr:hypothetical protein FGB62_115g013 [Gracilaria domingensis]